MRMKPNDDFKLGIIKNGKLEPGDEKFMINFDYPDEKYEIIYANIDNDPEKDSYLRSILGAQLKKPLLSGFERSLLHHYPPLILDEGIVPPPESFNPKI